MMENPMHDKDKSIDDIPPCGDALNEQVGGTHYKTGFQPIQLMEEVRMYACCSNILKYVFRHKNKGGRQDLEKALHYCDLLSTLGFQWYEGTYGSTDGSNGVFYQFIKHNPQLDGDQVRAILAICHRDFEELKKSIHALISKYK